MTFDNYDDYKEMIMLLQELDTVKGILTSTGWLHFRYIYIFLIESTDDVKNMMLFDPSILRHSGT